MLILSLVCISYDTGACVKNKIHLHAGIPLQEQLSRNNTEYLLTTVIRQRDDEVVIIPTNCSLTFQGGRIEGGMIVFNDTRINADQNQIFENVVIKGSVVNEEIWVDWFDDKESIKRDLFDAFIAVKELLVHKRGKSIIRFNQREYHYRPLDHKGFRSQVELVDVNNVTIDGMGATIVMDGEFGDVSNQGTENESIIQFRSTKQGVCKYITVRNLTLVGNCTIKYIGKGDGGSIGLPFRGVEKGIIENVVLSLWGTDGIYIGEGYAHRTYSKNIEIRNCEIYSCLRQGVSIVGCDTNCLIDSCYIHDIGGGSFQHCIDIESNPYNVGGEREVYIHQKNIKIANCLLENPAKACICCIRADGVRIENNQCVVPTSNNTSNYAIWLSSGNGRIEIVNNTFKHHKLAIYINKGGQDVLIERNNFETLLIDGKAGRSNFIYARAEDGEKGKTLFIDFSYNTVNGTGVEFLRSRTVCKNNLFYGIGGSYQFGHSIGKDEGVYRNRFDVETLKLNCYGTCIDNFFQISKKIESIANITTMFKNNIFVYSGEKVTIKVENPDCFINNVMYGGGLSIINATMIERPLCEAPKMILK